MRRITTRRVAVAAALAVVLPVAACGGADDDTTTLQVLAAASLTEVFTDLGERFEQEHPGVTVEFSFGSSTDLAEQAADGAPGDVLATADPTAMAVATDAGVAVDSVEFATNVLVIVTPPGNPGDIASLADLSGTTWVRCADEVPCGRAALAVLDAAGDPVDTEPASLEEDVRATLEKVVSGEADAGLVYASDAVAAGDGPDGVATVEIAGADRQANAYLVSPLEQSTDAELAAELTALVTGPSGRAALSDAGFATP
jgi:molybdate transport system substrate-binding protein